MPDVRYKGPSPEQRIADRLKNSGGGDLKSDHHAVHGTGPLRAHTNIHHSGTAGGSTTKTPNAMGMPKGGKGNR